MIRLIDDLTPLERLALIDISYSRLDSYHRCPAKYFYTYIQQEPRTFSAPAALGSIVHGVLERVEWEEPLNLADMVREFETQRPTHDPDREIGQTLIEAGYTQLTEFVDRHDGEQFDVLAVEMPFALVVGSALVTGYIDRVDRTPQGIHFIDYKTGKWEVAVKDIPTNLQLSIYALAISQRYPGENIRGELYYLRSGRRKTYDFSPEDLQRIEQDVIQEVGAVIEDQNFSFTDNVRECSFCDHRKSGTCKVGMKRYGGTT